MGNHRHAAPFSTTSTTSEMAFSQSEQKTSYSGESPQLPMDQSFDTTKCIFCCYKLSDFEANMSHMRIVHGFLIPSSERLQVDPETLVAYLDLIISEYSQCLFCETERSNPEAARQHMIGKGHCKFDITDEESEFRDFYDFEDVTTEDYQGENFATAKPGSMGFYNLDENSIRLQSGKILLDRSAHQPRQRQSPYALNAQTTTSNSFEQEKSSTVAKSNQKNQSLTTSERRGATLSTQLATLRASDRTSLMHLSSAQQRSQLSVEKKQVDEGRRAQRQMAIRLERKGNKTLMTHFRPDCPGGRKNG